MLGIISKIMYSELGIVVVRTSFARGVAASGSLLLGVILGRLYGAEGVGVFALFQSFLFGAGILARFGMDNALMRFVGAGHENTNVTSYLIWAVRRAFLLSIIAAIVIWFSRDLISLFFELPALSSLLEGCALATPAFTLAYIFSGFMKGMHRPASACLMESGYISLVTGGIVLLFTWLNGSGGISDAGFAMAISAWVVVVQGSIRLLMLINSREKKKGSVQVGSEVELDFAAFSISSRAFFVMSLAEFMQNVLSVLVAGWLLTSYDLGLFKVAERVAFLIGFILMIVAAIFPPRFASLYTRGEHASLARTARLSSLLGALMAFPILLVCLVKPEWLLSIFGSEFSEASPYLRIIAIAQTINVSTSAVGYLLNMTGHEPLMRNISLLCSAVGLVSFVFMIPLLGVLGAAISLGLVLVMQNVLALIFVRRRLGFWVYPYYR